MKQNTKINSIYILILIICSLSSTLSLNLPKQNSNSIKREALYEKDLPKNSRNHSSAFKLEGRNTLKNVTNISISETNNNNLNNTTNTPSTQTTPNKTTPLTSLTRTTSTTPRPVTTNQTDLADWEKFKALNPKKIYKNYRQEKNAFENFIRRRDRVGSKKNDNFKMKLNKFADMDRSKIDSKFLTATDIDFTKLPMKLSRKDPSSFNNIPNITIPEKLNLTDTTSVSTSTSTSTPTSTTVNLSQIKSENKNKNKNKQLAPINWVTAGMVAPVKNQGECGACWAYAATGMLESFYAIKNKRTFTEFSIQEMLDCTSAYTGLPGSCYGGSHSFAMYFAYNYAMNYETDYPLIGTQGICKLDLPEVSELLMTKGVYPVISEMEFKSSVTPQELYDILTNGPVAINIDASIDEFLFYSSGILSYACNAERSNHIMLLVGYGFDQESQQEYWLVKNSWGVNWGEKGYARLLKSDDWDGCYMYTNVVALK